MLPDGLWYFLISGSSGFFCAAARNVLFHVLDLRTPFINWFEYASLFVFLVALFSAGILKRDPINNPAILFKTIGLLFAESVLSSIVHSQMRTGQLFLIRCFDFLFTFTLLYLARGKKPSDKPSIAPVHLGLLAVFASGSWWEPGQLEYTSLSLLAAPILPVVRALRVTALHEAYDALSRPPLESFAVFYSGMAAVALLPPALLSLLTRDVQISASWESIDTALLSLSPLWFAFGAFADVWLITQLPLQLYAVSEHSRMTLASCGQWILQNMAHPSIIAFASKIGFVSTLARNAPALVPKRKA